MNVLPRRKGIAGFYIIVLLIGLTFLTSWVNDNYIVGTVLLGLSRVFSSNFLMWFSNFIHIDSLYADLSIYSWNSVNSCGIYWGFQFVWSIFGTINRWYFRQNWDQFDRHDIYLHQFRHLAKHFLGGNFSNWQKRRNESFTCKLLVGFLVARKKKIRSWYKLKFYTYQYRWWWGTKLIIYLFFLIF